MPPDPVSIGTRRNIQAIQELEAEFLHERTALERFTDSVTRFAGSPGFLIAHALLLAAWLGVNAGPWVFDPYPYQFLNFVVAVEAIFLATFVLMAQNRQSRQAEHWAHLALQIGLLSEQESTKMLEMLRSISGRLGLEGPARDRELGEMIRTTHVEQLARELTQARDEAGESPSAGGSP